MPDSPEVDYAVPASVPRSSRRERADRRSGPLWDGPGRTRLKVGCWVAAAVLAVPLLLPLVAPDEAGADSPEEAVAQLLQGIADVDAVAIVGAVDPAETDDPERAESAYDNLASRLLRVGEEVPADVTAVLEAAEGPVGGGLDRGAIATLAAVDLDLDGLSLRSTETGSGERALVLIEGGRMRIGLDPARLPDDVAGLAAASYEMPLAEGWRADEQPIDPVLVTVRRDGRWYVSLEGTARYLLSGRS